MNFEDMSEQQLTKLIVDAETELRNRRNRKRRAELDRTPIKRTRHDEGTRARQIREALLAGDGNEARRLMFDGDVRGLVE